MLFSSDHDREHECRLRVAMAMSGKFWPAHVQAILEAFGSLSAAFEADPKQLNAIKGLRGKRDAWLTAYQSDALDQELKSCADQGVTLLMLEDEAYPGLLREIPDPPMLLWVRGEITEADQSAMAIVGSRSASTYALHQTRVFADQLAKEGVTIVSGLARGIDTEAHLRALKQHGRTIAVLGSGFSFLYPKENRALADEIAENGALVSEFPLATKALPANFPRRNRIVSGLSQGVLVVQAGERSGSLITARLANEQNRDVFALPSRIDSDDNIGGLKLIRDASAALVISPIDIFRALPSLGHTPVGDLPASKRPAPAVENEQEAAIVQHLSFVDAVNVEALIAETKFDASTMGATLMMLEMRGIVKQLPGSNYILAE